MGKIVTLLVAVFLAVLAAVPVMAQAPSDAGKTSAAKEAPKQASPPAAVEPKTETPPPALDARKGVPPAAAKDDSSKAGATKTKRRMTKGTKRKHHARGDRRHRLVQYRSPGRHHVHGWDGARHVRVSPEFARRHFGGYFASGRDDCWCDRRRYARHGHSWHR
jgi:hypothetical protein